MATELIAQEEPDREESGDAKPVEKPGLAFYGALALVGILALLVFFANVEGTRASAGMEITKSSWTLQSYSGMTGNLIPVLPGSDVTARFGPGGQVSGSAGCNQYVATYILKDYGITVSSVTGTGMYCNSPGVMRQEAAYLSDLPNASIIRISNNSLNIYDDAGRTLMIFRSG